MGKTDYPGIDYGMGLANVDKETGIRYGVIGCNSLSPYFWDDVEHDYWRGCPECGTEFGEECNDWRYCPHCGHHDIHDSGWHGDESMGWHIDDDPDYLVTDCLDNDAMVLRSPFYTYAQFCSPCVPGAGNLDSPTDKGIGAKCYCFGSDWFDKDFPCPYPIYRVDDDSLMIL